MIRLLLLCFLLLSCNKPSPFVYYINKTNYEILNKYNKTKLFDLYNEKYIYDLEESQRKIAEHFYKTYISRLNNDFIQEIFSKEHIRFALLEQIKYKIPASIKLAQAYLESKKNGKWEYSDHIYVTNNLFGIKGQGYTIPTTEIVKQTSLSSFNNKDILYQKDIVVNNQKFIKLVIKDNFKVYETKWHSFRDHSLKLQQKRYLSLYKLPKSYKEWANKLGNTNTGGLGYATATNYGEVLISIIEKYNLHLLDY